MPVSTRDSRNAGSPRAMHRMKSADGPLCPLRSHPLCHSPFMGPSSGLMTANQSNATFIARTHSQKAALAHACVHGTCTERLGLQALNVI